MPNIKKISKQASVKEVEKRIDAQYKVVLECLQELCSSFEEHSFEDMIHALSESYAAEMWGGEFDLYDAIAFMDSLRLLVRVGRSATFTVEDLEERIQDILSIDTVQRLEDLMYYIFEAFSTVSDKYEDEDFLSDMLFFGREVKKLLRECAKLTGHDKE